MSPSHLLSLAKTNSVLAGSGLVGAAGVGTVGWNSIGSYQFSENPLGGFDREFETQRIYRNNKDNVFGIKESSCYRRFFPGVRYARPAKFDEDKSNIAEEPKGVDLSGRAIGCGLVKFSQTKDKKAFIYKSELTFKTETQGFSMSLAITNMKETGKVNYEFWLMFLKKEGEAWKKSQDRGWHAVFDPWAHPGAPQLTTAVYVSGSPIALGVNRGEKMNVDEAEKKYKDAKQWESPKVLSGVWQSHPKGVTRGYDFLVNGTIERWGLRVYYGETTETDPKHRKSHFLLNTKMTISGHWQPAGNYCKGVKEEHKGDLEKVPQTDKDLCYDYR